MISDWTIQQVVLEEGYEIISLQRDFQNLSSGISLSRRVPLLFIAHSPSNTFGNLMPIPIGMCPPMSPNGEGLGWVNDSAVCSIAISFAFSEFGRLYKTLFASTDAILFICRELC